MIRQNAILFGLIVGAAGCAAVWLAAPALQGGQAVVEQQASVQLERARRLLHQFDHHLSFDAILAEGLRDEGVEPDPDDLADDFADLYQQFHEVRWEAYPPRDYREDVPLPARPSYVNIAGQIREGLQQQARLAAENERLLDQARRAVDEALAESSGPYTARTHAEANQLKAVVLYHQALARVAESQLLRKRGDGFRRDLLRLAAQADEARARTLPAADEQFADALSRLDAQERELRASLAEDEAALTELDETISRLETQLQEATASREEARRAIEQLRSVGANLSDPGGVEQFRARLMELSRRFREAARTADALEFGTFPRAVLDPGGDYLTGPYLENGSPRELTVAHGLRHYVHQHAVLTSAIETRREALTKLLEDAARLQGDREAQRATAAEAGERLREISRQAVDAYAELNRLDAEAFTIEENALALLDQAARFSTDAARNKDQWIREARDRTQNLSPEARERSAFETRQRSGWMAGFIRAVEADARLARAWVYYDRFAAYAANARILSALTASVEPGEIDVGSERLKAQEAQTAGIEQVTATMAALEAAHRQAERHWTLTAQAAGANYLLSLFGLDDYANDAIEAYREAVKGREDLPAAETFVSVLRRLESR